MWVLSTMMIPFSGNHNSFVFIIKSLGLVNSLLGHDTSYGSACIWRIPF